MTASEPVRANIHDPDVETSSAEYRTRFAGRAGRYFLDRQAATLWTLLEGAPPGRVLDVGGAHAQLAAPLAASGLSVTVHGTSPLCEANLRTLHGVQDCGFLLGPLQPLPASDRSFDTVIAIRLLTHVEDWQGVLGEMCRVAAYQVVFDFPSAAGVNALTPWLFSAKKRYERNTRTYRNFTIEELSLCLARYGFRAAAWSGQLVLPMVLHRMMDAAAPLRWIETISAKAGVTRVHGSPVLLKAVRLPGR